MSGGFGADLESQVKIPSHSLSLLTMLSQPVTAWVTEDSGAVLVVRSFLLEDSPVPGAREESQQPRVLLKVEALLVNRKLILHLLSPGERLFQPAHG